MTKPTLTPQDKQFLIKIAKHVDGIRVKQAATDTRMTTLEHNVHALHESLSRIEGELNQPAMFVTLKDLMPGFSKPDAQARFFRHALIKLMDEFKVKRLAGIIDR
jgi:hypothetical protein